MATTTANVQVDVDDANLPDVTDPEGPPGTPKHDADYKSAASDEEDRMTERSVKIFNEELPKVEVEKAVKVDSWPFQQAEYHLKFNYRSLQWKVITNRSKLRTLWTHVKQKTVRHKIELPALSSVVLNPTVDMAVSEEGVRLVQEYLDAIFSNKRLVNSTECLAFMEVSASTFLDGMQHPSIKEGPMSMRLRIRGDKMPLKDTRTCKCEGECCTCMCGYRKPSLRRRRQRWVVLRQSCLLFYNEIMATQPSEVLLFDDSMAMKIGLKGTGTSHGLTVSNQTFIAEMVAPDKQSRTSWANAIRNAIDECEYGKKHRFGSYSPIINPQSSPCQARWFINAEHYYPAVYEALKTAKKEVFLAGWWLCPELYLKRPPRENEDSRLDRVIKALAERGVKIYVMVYKEVKAVLTLNSFYTKKQLLALHPNVYVIRDPDFIVKQLGLWSHHEKLVCIDQSTCFVGGLDLCFGRYETTEYRLWDDKEPVTWPGKDYSNPRIKDFIEVDKPFEDLQDRTKLPRMPWHDIHSRLIGQPAREVSRHFIQRWNYSRYTRSKSSTTPALYPLFRFPPPATHSPKSRFRKAAQRVQLLRKTANRGFSTGKASFLDGELADDKKASINMTDNEDAPLPPKLPGDKAVEPVTADEVTLDDDVPVYCQLTRSLSRWSGGVSTELSIQTAYIRLISEAKHFVYIENQFFCSGMENDSDQHNRIVDALYQRLRRAVMNSEKFRVFVVMPLLPAFPGSVTDDGASSLRGVMHWQYRAISRGGASLYERLSRLVEDPFEYVAFYGLRTYQEHNGTPETEQIYIHSKLMIVDDRITIMGSANINDRSMMGERDSEMAVVIEDSVLTPSVLAGEVAYVGKFSHSLRMSIFADHYHYKPGTEDYAKIKDPVALDTWWQLQEQAARNSYIYEKVFAAMPSDNVKAYAEIAAYSGQGPPTPPQSSSPPANGGKDKDKGSEQEKKTDDEPKQESEEGKTDPHQGHPEDRVKQEESHTEEFIGDAKKHGPMYAFRKLGAMDMGSHDDKLGDQPGQQLAEGVTADDIFTSTGRQAGGAADTQLLSQIQGNIVYFPLDFLVKENLVPGLMPAELFN